MKHCDRKTKNELIETRRQKEQADKKLLSSEVVIGFLCMAIFAILTTIASLVPMKDWLRNLLIVAGVIPFLIACPYMLKIEQIAGYYECTKCGHRYVPTYKSVFWAPHACRTRRMRCPKCNKKSWQKKKLRK